MAFEGHVFLSSSDDEEHWEACPLMGAGFRGDSCASFLWEALTLLLFSLVQAQIMWHYVADKRERKCLGLLESWN